VGFPEAFVVEEDCAPSFVAGFADDFVVGFAAGFVAGFAGAFFDVTGFPAG